MIVSHVAARAKPPAIAPVHRRLIASLLALLLATASSFAAWADEVIADGDIVTAGPQDVALNIGSVCSGTSVVRTIDIHAVRSGGTNNNTWANGAVLTTSLVSAHTSIGVSFTSTTGTLPADWVNGTSVPPVVVGRATITYTAPTVTSNTPIPNAVEVEFKAQGLRQGSTTAINEKTDKMRLAGTVVPSSNAACDRTPPVISGMPADITLEATGSAGAVATWSAPTAVDAVDGASPVTCSPSSGSTFAIATTTVTCSSSDTKGNTASQTFSVTVRDTTAPVISGMPAGVTLEATGSSGATHSWTPPTATDLVDGARPVSCAPASGSTFGLGVTTVTCSSSDTRSNTSSRTFQVTVADTAAPVITGMPASFDLEATGPSGAVATWAAPTATDSVAGTVPVTCDPTSGATFAVGETTVTCSAQDGHGNSASAAFKITVLDTTAPVISGMPDLTLEATGPSGAEASWDAPTATDTVDGTVAVSCDATSGTTFPLGDTLVTCTAEDAQGNSSYRTFTVSVVDTTAPVISGTPRDMTREAGGPSGAAASWDAPTASDVVDGAVDVVCAPRSGGIFRLGDTTVTCTAVDAAGNGAESTFTVSVVDTTAPVISGMPEDLTLEATGPTGADASWDAPTASDVVDGAVDVLCAPASGGTFPLGDTTVTCTAVDAAGNEAGSSFTISVVDTTAPVISGMPEDLTLEATGPSGAEASWDAPTARDLVDGLLAVDCDAVSGSVFGLGTTLVVCSVEDAAGNLATEHFLVRVVDTTAPVISGMPEDLTLEATGPSGAPASWAAPTADDVVDGSVAVDCDPASGGTYAIGETEVTCTATDAAGNERSATFTVTVVDTTAPLISGMPDDITREATGASGAVAGWTPPSSIDVVDGPVAVRCDPASGATFPLGTTTVECSATDRHGNRSVRSFDVTVRDTTAPVISGMPADVVREATGPSGATASWVAPSALDAVDGIVPVVCAPVAGTTFALGMTTVTCSSEDAAGNVATRSFTVTVRDTTAPVIAGMPGNVNANASSAAGAVVSWPAPTATDIVDGARTVTCDRASGSTFPVGETLVRCSASDSRGNASSATFTVKVGYAFGGWQAPVNALPTRNVVKAGRAIPVKFSLGGDMGTAIFANSTATAAGSPTTSSTSCTPTGTDPVEETLTAGSSSLSYDAATGTYNYVWKTDTAWAGKCRVFTLNLKDGSTHRFEVQFTK